MPAHQHPPLGPEAPAQLGEHGGALDQVGGRGRDGGQVTGLRDVPRVRMTGLRLLGRLSPARENSQLIKPGGQFRLGTEPESGQEDRGHRIRVGPPSFPLQTAYLRLAVANGYPQLAPRQPRPLPQHPQELAELGNRRGWQSRTSAIHLRHHPLTPRHR
jgi:hypothetical protein